MPEQQFKQAEELAKNDFIEEEGLYPINSIPNQNEDYSNVNDLRIVQQHKKANRGKRPVFH